MATVNLPSFLAMPTGHTLLDVMPCVTLVACLPTLHIFRQRGRSADLAIYTLGFFLALTYHVCHMHKQGIAHAVWLGIDGPTWRTLDILCCQLMLARTVGHACGDDHPVIHGIPNIALPACLGYLRATSDRLEMSMVSALTLLSLLGTVAVKLVLEGPSRMPSYSRGAGAKILLNLITGFAFFVLPNRLPDHYWLWHSLWHVFMGLGYYELYSELTSDKQEQHKAAAARKAQAAAAAAAKRGKQGTARVTVAVEALSGGADAGAWGLGMMGSLLARVALVTWPQLKQH